MFCVGVQCICGTMVEPHTHQHTHTHIHKRNTYGLIQFHKITVPPKHTECSSAVDKAGVWVGDVYSIGHKGFETAGCKFFQFRYTHGPTGNRCIFKREQFGFFQERTNFIDVKGFSRVEILDDKTSKELVVQGFGGGGTVRGIRSQGSHGGCNTRCFSGLFVARVWDVWLVVLDHAGVGGDRLQVLVYSSQCRFGFLQTTRGSLKTRSKLCSARNCPGSLVGVKETDFRKKIGGRYSLKRVRCRWGKR